MSFVAILGAGPIGAAVTHRLAARQRVPAIRLIDAAAATAAGKALDIRQSGPIEGVDTPITSSGDVLAACGASVIVLADDSASGEWSDDAGVTLMTQLVRAGTSAAFVFAGAHQTTLLEACYRDLKISADRLVGAGPAAIVGAVQALAGLEIGASGVRVTVLGRAPDFVVVWSSASVAGAMLTDRIPAHRLSAMSQSLSKLWPPGAYAIASATAPIVEALLVGSREAVSATTIVDGEMGVRGRAVLLPVQLGRHRVLARVMPSLSPQERTGLVNSLGALA